VSARFRRTGERGRLYVFRDRRCLEAECWAPGVYQHRGATSSGSRSTGTGSPCCLRNAYHGCPSDVVYVGELERARRAEGWRPA
jgi:hypothetical protein